MILALVAIGLIIGGRRVTRPARAIWKVIANMIARANLGRGCGSMGAPFSASGRPTPSVDRSEVGLIRYGRPSDP